MGLHKQLHQYLLFTLFFCLGEKRKTGPEVIKLFTCSTLLGMKFLLFINVKMLTIVGISTFMNWNNINISLSEPKKC